MTYEEKSRLEEIYLKACVEYERSKDNLEKARRQHKKLSNEKLLYTVATARQCALIDVMVAFFDDVAIDMIEDEAKARYQADPTLFLEED